jgi:hypothetical protein
MPYHSLALRLELAGVGRTAVVRHVFENSAEVAEADAVEEASHLEGPI